MPREDTPVSDPPSGYSYSGNSLVANSVPASVTSPAGGAAAASGLQGFTGSGGGASRSISAPSSSGSVAPVSLNSLASQSLVSPTSVPGFLGSGGGSLSGNADVNTMGGGSGTPADTLAAVPLPRERPVTIGAGYDPEDHHGFMETKNAQVAYNDWARANGRKTIKEDGLFGQETKRALSTFKLAHGITSWAGEIDPDTRAALSGLPPPPPPTAPLIPKPGAPLGGDVPLPRERPPQPGDIPPNDPNAVKKLGEGLPPDQQAEIERILREAETVGPVHRELPSGGLQLGDTGSPLSERQAFMYGHKGRLEPTPDEKQASLEAEAAKISAAIPADTTLLEPAPDTVMPLPTPRPNPAAIPRPGREFTSEPAESTVGGLTPEQLAAYVKTHGAPPAEPIVTEPPIPRSALDIARAREEAARVGVGAGPPENPIEPAAVTETPPLPRPRPANALTELEMQRTGLPADATKGVKAKASGADTLTEADRADKATLVRSTVPKWSAATLIATPYDGLPKVTQDALVQKYGSSDGARAHYETIRDQARAEAGKGAAEKAALPAETPAAPPDTPENRANYTKALNDSNATSWTDTDGNTHPLKVFPGVATKTRGAASLTPEEIVSDLKAKADDGADPKGEENVPAPPPRDIPSEKASLPPEGGDVGQGRVIEAQAGIRSKRLNDPTHAMLDAAAKDAGVDFRVFSGAQDASGKHRTGSHRHDVGPGIRAADGFLVDHRTGRVLNYDNLDDRKTYVKFITAAIANGATGFGAGHGYMAQGSMHVGGGSRAAWGRDETSATAPQWLKDAVAAGFAARDRSSGTRSARRKG